MVRRSTDRGYQLLLIEPQRGELPWRRRMAFIALVSVFVAPEFRTARLIFNEVPT